MLSSLPEHAQLPPSPIQFTNIAKSAGIRFVHFKGNRGTSINLEEFGPGVCVADFDNDGWPDIYFVNGRDRYNRGISVRNALYHNNGDRTFTDVTDKARVPGTGYGLGCVWGDYDNDGLPDLFVTQYGRNVLYHNNGDGTFTDVTDKAGVAGLESGAFHSGATFFDYDRDGYLDLYVGSYVALEPSGPRYCMLGTVKSSCPPAAYGGSANALYHNNGDGTFTNVTQSARILQPNGKNLSVGAADYDNDGWPDLFVANDGLEAYLYHNEHNGTFTEIGAISGMAYGANGKTMAAMCISFGDYDNDGWLDLYISDFQGSSDHLWHNDGKAKSNHDAMGARIRIVAGGVSQIREISGGGSYLSQSELRAHFGLGKNLRADSVEIKWPSGQADLFQNVPADQFYRIEEGGHQLRRQQFSRPSSATTRNALRHQSPKLP